MRPPKKVVLDTSSLLKQGQFAMLRKLEEARIIKLYISSDTADFEYHNRFEKVWKDTHEAEFKRAGVSVAQQKQRMAEDKRKMDILVSRVEVVDVTREEADAYKSLFRDKSDSFLAATAAKVGATQIVSSDGQAPDFQKLRAAGFAWAKPDQFMAQQAKNRPDDVGRALRRERIPNSLSKLKSQVEYNKSQVESGMVHIPPHIRNGGPVESHWRSPRDAAAYREEVIKERRG